MVILFDVQGNSLINIYIDSELQYYVSNKNVILCTFFLTRFFELSPIEINQKSDIDREEF